MQSGSESAGPIPQGTEPAGGQDHSTPRTKIPHCENPGGATRYYMPGGPYIAVKTAHANPVLRLFVRTFNNEELRAAPAPASGAAHTHALAAQTMGRGPVGAPAEAVGGGRVRVHCALHSPLCAGVPVLKVCTPADATLRSNSIGYRLSSSAVAL